MKKIDIKAMYVVYGVNYPVKCFIDNVPTHVIEAAICDRLYNLYTDQ